MKAISRVSNLEIGAVITLALAFGLSFPLNKLALRGFSPLEVALTCALVGMIASLVLALIRKDRFPRRFSTYLQFSAIGLFLVAPQLWALSWSVDKLRAARVGVMLSATIMSVGVTALMTNNDTSKLSQRCAEWLRLGSYATVASLVAIYFFEWSLNPAFDFLPFTLPIVLGVAAVISYRTSHVTNKHRPVHQLPESQLTSTAIAVLIELATAAIALGIFAYIFRVEHLTVPLESIVALVSLALIGIVGESGVAFWYLVRVGKQRLFYSGILLAVPTAVLGCVLLVNEKLNVMMVPYILVSVAAFLIVVARQVAIKIAGEHRFQRW